MASGIASLTAGMEARKNEPRDSGEAASMSADAEKQRSNEKHSASPEFGPGPPREELLQQLAPAIADERRGSASVPPSRLSESAPVLAKSDLKASTTGAPSFAKAAAKPSAKPPPATVESVVIDGHALPSREGTSRSIQHTLGACACGMWRVVCRQ